jgi:hypothetical protein
MDGNRTPVGLWNIGFYEGTGNSRQRLFLRMLKIIGKYDILDEYVQPILIPTVTKDWFWELSSE